MAKLKYKLTNDILFKMLFVRNQDLLKRLTAAFLRVPVIEINEFTVTNPEMPPEALGEKFCRLDIKMLVNGQILDLEIQVADEKDFRERSLFHWARAFSSALDRGKGYISLPKTIVVSILAFPLFECEKFHSEFDILETTRHERLTDKLNMHYFELPKLPKNVIENDSGSPDDFNLWLALFNAKTEEDLEKIQAIGGEIMKKVVEAYHYVSTTDEFKELERLRFDASCNEAAALHAKAIEIAKSLKTIGKMTIDEIAEATKLSVDEVLKA